MIYCEKCSRLLDEDLKVCPYCGNNEENAEITKVKSETDQNALTEEKIEDVISNGLGTNEKVTPSVKGQFASNETINTNVVEHIKINETDNMSFGQEPFVQQTTGSESNHSNQFNNPNQMFENKALNNKINNQGQSFNNQGTKQQTMDNTIYKTTLIQEEKPLSTILGVILIIGTLIFPLIGIVGGIVLMISESKSFKRWGIAMLATGITVIILWVICCCAFGFLNSIF